MVKKIILGLGLVGMIALSGCSDTKESLEADAKELMKECSKALMESDKDMLKECDEKGKDLDARMKALNKDEK